MRWLERRKKWADQTDFKIMETNSEEIEMILSSEEDSIFTYTDLSLVLNENRDAWRLPKATTISDFIKFLSTKGKHLPN